MAEQEELEKYEVPCYVGKVHPNCDYHHGQIPPAKGVQCFQVTRANRGHGTFADGTTSTYKHAADVAYFHGRFYIQYLCNAVDEHEPGGYSVLTSAGDNLKFEQFQVSFPAYQIPKCIVKDYKQEIHAFSGKTYGFMHQRMSFFRSSDDRMLVLGFYGWSPQKWMTNWDNYGIGRVVRELYPDGTLGDIYFIRPNWQAGWTEELLNYPMYTKCKDTGFVQACEELLANPLYVQQWAEENGDIDPLIQIKHPGGGKTYQAFNWYHIDESTVIGLWKHSLAARSNDGGRTWGEVTFTPSLVMSGQKIWGEKLSDGTFALVYDPTLETQHRYPLCLTTSSDGIHFDKMRLIHGEVPMTRYAGFWKDFGPQYMRGIAEGLVTKEDNPGKDLYVTYSVNKEDIWIARIPVPVEDETKKIGKESFEQSEVLDNWNLYAPVWARPGIVKTEQGRALRILDKEPCDYGKAERLLVPEAKKKITIDISANPTQGKAVYIQLCDSKAAPAVKLIFRDNEMLYVRTVTEIGVCNYAKGQRYRITIEADCKTFSYELLINGNRVCDSWGNPIIYRYMGAVNELSRLMFSTGDMRHLPDLSVDPEKISDLPRAISEVKTDGCCLDIFEIEEA